ncbi:uncharacterized protein DUF4231 [Asanoa ferruginea]|uniref:Uncharacterized protein DUF4231 n=1 Tax=Asanoa ferruginea TaxID=53367 RepID=A0A3D9ZMV3_9ACTN|nr:DUF4231 domain-containing protein [Asanoa ferruginea]REF98571.1 uncharacterized protein DUF4231 [Asanoa ferruginea]GIF53506.1 hypothetical protein Afe04nite_80450 [Asanoa ferruginea]
MTTPTLGRGLAEWVWEQQSVWSQAASAAKARIVRSRLILLALTVAAALAGTVATQVGGAWSRVFAGVAAAALAAAPVLARGTSPKSVAEWTRLRSVSEALKAETYQRLAGVKPYRGADPDETLKRRAGRIINDASDLAAEPGILTPAVRPLPAVSDVTSYARERVEKQLTDYYRPRAKHLAEVSARYLRAATFVSLAIAVTSAVSAIVGANLSVWVGVVTTFSASLVAFSTAQRYSYQQLEFARTATQLSLLLSTFPGDADPARADHFVAESERVISVSNDAWMAKQTEADEPA